MVVLLTKTGQKPEAALGEGIQFGHVPSFFYFKGN